MSNVKETEKKKPGFFSRIGKTFRDMRGEMKRVVWPSKKQTVNNTVIVLVFMAFMAVIIGLFDFGLSVLIKMMVGA